MQNPKRVCQFLPDGRTEPAKYAIFLVCQRYIAHVCVCFCVCVCVCDNFGFRIMYDVQIWVMHQEQVLSGSETLPD